MPRVLPLKKLSLKRWAPAIASVWLFREIEVINDDLGKPVIHAHGKVKEFIDKQGIKSNPPEHFTCERNGQCFCGFGGLAFKNS